MEVRDAQTFTKRLTDEERNAARNRLKQERQAEKDAKRRHAVKTGKQARKAAKVARKAIERAKPAKKPAFKSTWNAYRPGMSSAEFCRTREWAELRQRVLVRYGAVCQCCGASRHTGATMHVDHIKPRSKFPALELVEDNLQVLCELCNIGKSNTHQTDWR
jgi:5-methylcytosine-specific restriction endonuclease McrA